MRKKALRLLSRGWLWLAIIVVAFGAWGLAFYWISRPSSELTLQVWIGSRDWLQADDEQAMRSLCEEHGMQQCSFNRYSPADSMYAQAFAVKAATVDLFVLQKDEALAIAEADLFAPLQGYAGALDYQGTAIGLPVGDDMYLLVNKDLCKNAELIEDILQYFANKV